MGVREDGIQDGGVQEDGASQPAAKRTGAPVWARKSSLVLIIAAMALAAFGSTTQTWLTVHLDPAQLGQAVNSQDGLQVQGSKAATTVTALALVALAGGLAASIAGRIARWIITAIIVLARPASSPRPSRSWRTRSLLPRAPSRQPPGSPGAACR